MLKDRLLDVLMPLLPKNDLSHWVGRAVHKKIPGPVGALAVQAFAKFYNINMKEAEKPLEQYESIGALFTRRLKPGVRPIGSGIVHPCDAVISQVGAIESGQCVQAKDKSYTVAELLRNHHWAERLEGGCFITYYLCPTDYHRVHAPLSGKIPWMMHAPGELWPVNEWSVQAIENLFTVNERIAFLIEEPTSLKMAALVMVAATNVGNMTLSFDEQVTTNVLEPERHAKEKVYAEPPFVNKGDEVGIFHMGSTVVMLYEKGLIKTDLDELAKKLMGQAVKMGEKFS
jgi:phosphatidylserine decarboxylase